MTLAELKKKYRDAILDGMARALWIDAYIRWAEDLEQQDVRPLDRDVEVPDQGEDWDDYTPDTPHAAHLAARALAKLIAASEGMDAKSVLADLFELAMTIDEGEFQFDEQGLERGEAPSEVKRKERDRKLELAEDFGNGIANESLGNGVSWGDNHRTRSVSGVFDPKLPRFTVNYDGSDLTWEGFVDAPVSGSKVGQHRHVGRGQQQAYYDDGEVATDTLGSLVVVNRNDQSWTKHSYVLWFGSTGTRRLLVYANSLGDAFDEAIDWAEDNAPGLLADDEVEDAYNQAISEGKSEDEAREYAEQDMVTGGNAGHHIVSMEWGILAEDPDLDQLYELAGFTDNPTTRAARKNPLETEDAEMVMQVQGAIGPEDPIMVYRPEVFSVASPEGRRWTGMYEPPSAHSVFLRIHPAEAARSLDALTRAEYGQPLEGKLLETHVRTLLGHLTDRLNRQWPLPGAIWTTKAWGWGYLALTDQDDKTPSPVTIFVIGYNVDATRQNPANLTAKGERMYDAIKRGYTAVGAARAREIASRTVLSSAKHGTKGLIKPAASRARRARGRKRR